MVSVCERILKRALQAESSKGFSLRLANEYVHFHLHCFFDNNDVPLGETKGAIDSRMCWASLQEVGREAALIALLGASRLHLIGQLEEPPIRRGGRGGGRICKPASSVEINKEVKKCWGHTVEKQWEQYASGI